MKTFLLSSAAWAALSFAVLAQTPTPPEVTPAATPTATATATATVSATLRPTVAPSVPADEESTGKHKAKRHFRMTIGDKDEDIFNDKGHDEDAGWLAVPIIAIIFTAIFGAPVAIVALIMLISWAKARSLHRTVREMVAKGQPVPPELLGGSGSATAPLRPWWDLRRGIVLLAVGVGIMMFFGVSAGWDVGVWALGLIPALIGLGYLLAWRLAYREEKALKQ